MSQQPSFSWGKHPTQWRKPWGHFPPSWDNHLVDWRSPRTLLDKPHMIRSKPLKTNGWIPKMTPCLKGDIFSKPSFLVSMLDFWGVNSVLTRVASTTDRQTNENQQHPLRQKTTIAQLNIAWHNGKSDDNSHAVSAKKFDASLDLFRP